MKTTISRPDNSDWPSILALLKSANLDQIGGKEMPEFPLSDCFIARESGLAVGVCGYRITGEKTARNTLTAISPQHRSNGLATRLKRVCLDYLADRGIKEITTNCDDPAVISWNERNFGFQRSGRLIPKQQPFGRTDVDEWVNMVSRAPFRTFHIPESEIEAYKSRGYIALRGRFTDREAGMWADESDRIWNLPGLIEQENDRVQGRDSISGARVLERLNWVTPLSESFTALANDERIIEPVTQLFGEVPVLLRDKLIIRPPGTLGYGLHQDFPYWEKFEIPADQILTVCIAIDRTDELNGTLGMFPGYHDRCLKSPPGAPLDAATSEVDEQLEDIIDLDPGDMLIFHSLVPHHSAANRSDLNRRILYLTYTTGRQGPDEYQRCRDLVTGTQQQK